MISRFRPHIFLQAFRTPGADPAQLTQVINTAVSNGLATHMAADPARFGTPFVSLLKSHLERGDLGQARQLFNAICRSELPRNAAIYSVLVHAYLAESRLAEARELIREFIERGAPVRDELAVSMFNSLMSFHLRRGELGHVKSVFDEVRAHRLVLNLTTFRILMRAAIAANDEARVWKLLRDEMRAARVEPDAEIYAQAVGDALLRHGYETAMALADLSVAPAMLKSTEFYTALIVILRNRDAFFPAVVEQLHERMLRTGVAHDSLFLGHAMHVCQRANDDARTRRFALLAEQHEEAPTALLLISMLRWLCAQHNTDAAEQLLRRHAGSVELNVQPLIELLAARRDLAGLRRVTSEFGAHLRPEDVCKALLPLLRAYSFDPATRDRALAEQTLGEMRRANNGNVPFDAHSYMMHLYAAVGEPELAFNFYNSGLVLTLPKDILRVSHFKTALRLFQDEDAYVPAIVADMRRDLGSWRAQEVLVKVAAELKPSMASQWTPEVPLMTAERARELTGEAKPLVCYNCQAIGHVAKACPLPQNRELRKNARWLLPPTTR